MTIIPMFFAIWVCARHGVKGAIIATLVWGLADVADLIIRIATGMTIVEHILGDVTP